jgi:hypothetical protein
VNPLNRYDVELRVKARKIPNWTADEKGAVNPLQKSPAKSAEPVETVTLIPMGAARLRIASFPVIGTGADAHEWKQPPRSPVSASHVNPSDTVAALVDGREPRSSSDSSLPRFTWWDHKGGREWVQYDFETLRRVSRSRVYWFDDRGTGGGCRVPESWTLLYRDSSGGAWKPVRAKGAYGVDLNRFNEIELEPVQSVRRAPSGSAAEELFGRHPRVASGVTALVARVFNPCENAGRFVQESSLLISSTSSARVENPCHE